MIKVFKKIFNIIVFILFIPLIPFVWEQFKMCTEYQKIKKVENWFNKKFGWFFCPPTKQGKEEQNKIYK